MRLKSLYIENFGNLSNFSYNFSSSLNCFKENNGYGKSTLAAFIKAMLYGMETTKENTKDFKDRKHYAPFNENTYGGTLIFEHDNKEYRVERTFDAKSSAKDKTKITVDGVEKEFECLGEELLGLDKESYDRLLFLNEHAIKMESNGNIKQNLSSSLDETIQGVNFEEILETLNEAEKLYTKNKNNKIYNVNEEKKELENEIHNQENTLSSLYNKKDKRNTLDQEISKKEALYNEMHNKKVTLECFETYEAKLNKIDEKERNLKIYQEKYQKGLPTSEEINELEKNYQDKDNATILLNSLVFDKKEELDFLNNKYKNGCPNDAEIKKLDELNKTRNTLKEEALKNVFNNESKLQELKAKYKSIPSEEELDKINDLDKEFNVLNYQLGNEFIKEDQNVQRIFVTKDYQGDKEKLDVLFTQYKTQHNVVNINNTNASNNKKVNKVSKSAIITLISAIVLVVIGLCLIPVNIIPCIILIALGVILCLASGFLYFKNYIDKNAKANVIVNGTNVNEIKDIEEKIKTILIPYGIYSNSLYDDYLKFTNSYDKYLKFIELTNKKEKLLAELKTMLEKYLVFKDVEKAMKDIQDDIKTYHTLTKEFEEYEKNKTQNEFAIKENETSIKEITNKYNLNISSSEQFYNLCKDIEKLKDLTNEYNNKEMLRKENNEKCKNATQNMQNILQKYALTQEINTNLINELKQDSFDFNALVKQIQNEKIEAEEYKKLKKLDTKPNFENVDLDTLKNELDDLKNQLIKLNQEISSCELEVESLEEHKEKLKNLKLEEIEYKQRLNILKKTEEILKEAQRKLDDKYVSPIKEKFDKYEDILSNTLNVKIDFTRELKILLEVNGKQKDSNHLSTGQTTICALCFRLALLDNIYKNDTPFIIMDDPFSLLDEQNFNAIKEMLTKNFQDKQIIYFTCHESRLINN